MKKLILMSSLVCALPATAFAQFEGLIEMKMTAPQGTGAMKLAVGKPGVRTEIEVQTPMMPVKFSMLVKSSNLDVAYRIDDASKTYTEMNLKTARDELKKSPVTYTAKKLGDEKVLGYDCTHAMVTSSKGDEVEVWTNKKVLDYELFLKAAGRQGMADESMMKALKEVGADGFIMKMTHKGPQGDQTMEVVKVEKKKMPAATFEVPAGYTKSEGAPTLGGLPPGAAEQLKEKMRNMTPEQRDMMKKMMEKKGPRPEGTP